MKIIILTAIPQEHRIACKELGLKKINNFLYEKKSNSALIEVILTGPGKASAAQTTAAFIAKLAPDLIIDSGACAGTGENVKIGDLILAFEAYEIDLGYKEIPSKIISQMQVASSIVNLDETNKKMIKAKASELAFKNGIRLICGKLACGDRILTSTSEKEKLTRVFDVEGFCWETAAVFLAAKREGKPALSLRAITDLGNEQALYDFNQNLKKVVSSLYNFIGVLYTSCWFEEVFNIWKRLPENLRQSVF